MDKLLYSATHSEWKDYNLIVASVTILCNTKELPQAIGKRGVRLWLLPRLILPLGKLSRSLIR